MDNLTINLKLFTIKRSSITLDIDIDIDSLFPKIRARQCHDRALQIVGMNI